eukprot:30507-Eustigmatos_ZCMA.PRE.1
MMPRPLRRLAVLTRTRKARIARLTPTVISRGRTTASTRTAKVPIARPIRTATCRGTAMRAIRG